MVRFFRSRNRQLPRYVVLCYSDGYWIAMNGYRSFRRALKKARYYENWGITAEADVVDSRDYSHRFHKYTASSTGTSSRTEPTPVFLHPPLHPTLVEDSERCLTRNVVFGTLNI